MFEEQPKGATEFATLRQLLVGPERQQLDELADRVEQVAVTPQMLADQLPEAIALRTSRDRQLGRALAPTVETALRESIRRNPRDIASAIFPVLGPAIRKAIAETMAELVRSINSAVEHSLSVQGIKWRIEAWRTGERYADVVIKHALVYRVEQVFLIHAETGLLLAHVTAPNLNVPDADLISGMLTAIQDFVRDSFRPDEGGTLSAFTVGEHTVHVEAGPRAVIAGVIRGQCPESVPLRLERTLEQIHLEYATQLGDFEGDAVPFGSTAPLLEENLETVLSTDRGTNRATMVWLRWAIPLAAIALLAIGLARHRGCVGGARYAPSKQSPASSLSTRLARGGAGIFEDSRIRSREIRVRCSPRSDSRRPRSPANGSRISRSTRRWSSRVLVKRSLRRRR